MIRIVTPDNRHLFSKQLEDMFRMRARAAVEEMGWQIEIDQKERDIDQFDYDDTIYVLYFMPDGSVGGCARLNPTNREHLISEIFPEMCQGDVPTGEKIWEYSRYLIERQGKTQREYLRAWLLIGQAINEYCISAGITHVTWLARLRLYKMAVGVWKTRPLGLPKYFEDDQKSYVAGISEMSLAGLPNVKKYSKHDMSLLDYSAPPAVTQPNRKAA